MKHPGWAVLACTLLCAFSDAALAQAPSVRARLVPGGAVTVGEPVSLEIDVLTPTWFLGAPEFPVLDVDGAIVTGPGRTLNLSERRGRDTWSGVQRVYTIIPVGPGTMEVPSITIRIRFAGGDGKPVDGAVTTRSLRFEASVPAEARGLRYFIAATRLTVRQTLEPRADTLKVGGALTRSVTTVANDAQAMLLPPLPTEPIPGLGVYADPPIVVNEGGERGSQRVGRRVDAVTYVMEQEGTYELPAFEVAWWDVRAKRVRRTAVDAVRIHVVPDPEAVTELPIPADQDSTGAREAAAPTDMRFLLWLLPALVLAGWFARVALRRAIPRMATWWQERESRRRNSEQAHFARVAGACRSGDARAAMRALTAWLNRISSEGRLQTLDGLVADSQDTRLAEAVAALQQHLYGRRHGAAGAWNGASLSRALGDYRKARRSREAAGERAAALPMLNPTG